MTNPVIFEILSKTENQNRARQLVQIQRINQAAKTRTKRPHILSILKLRLSNYVSRFSMLQLVKNRKKHHRLTVEQK